MFLRVVIQTASWLSVQSVTLTSIVEMAQATEKSLGTVSQAALLHMLRCRESTWLAVSTFHFHRASKQSQKPLFIFLMSQAGESASNFCNIKEALMTVTELSRTQTCWKLDLGLKHWTHPPAKSPMPFLFRFGTWWCLELFYEAEETVEPQGGFEIAQLLKLQLKLSSLRFHSLCFLSQTRVQF